MIRTVAPYIEPVVPYIRDNTRSTTAPLGLNYITTDTAKEPNKPKFTNQKHKECHKHAKGNTHRGYNASPL